MREPCSGYQSPYAASAASWIGSTIAGSSFSGLLTRVEIGHIRIGSAGYGCIRSRGSGSLGREVQPDVYPTLCPC
jgi:hypothetical protein